MRIHAVITCLLATNALSCAVPAIRPFTLETVMADLAKSHPQAKAPADELPPEVRALENVTYRETPSGELQLDLYRPAGETPHPAVLLVHGGGWLSGDRRMERAFAKQLARRGFVAVPVSYRLGASGRFPAPVHDLKAAVRWLRAHAVEHGIDGHRIAIAGGSAGGTLALLAGASNGLRDLEEDGAPSPEASQLQAVIDIDGTATFLENTLIKASETRPENPYLEFLHGPYRASRATWAAASPINYVGPWSAPTLFIKSTVTAPVLVGRDEMSERLRIFGIRSEVVVYPDTPHPFWLVEPWFTRTLDDTEKFLKAVFGGHAGGD